MLNMILPMFITVAMCSCDNMLYLCLLDSATLAFSYDNSPLVILTPEILWSTEGKHIIHVLNSQTETVVFQLNSSHADSLALPVFILNIKPHVIIHWFGGLKNTNNT